MIDIFDVQGKKIKSIFNPDEYFNFVSAGELLEDHLESANTNIKWSFVVFPPQSVHELYFKLKQEHLTPSIKDAFKQELGIIEVCKGDYLNPTWVPIIPGLDIGELKKDWYLDFCKRHGYIIKHDVHP